MSDSMKERRQSRRVSTSIELGVAGGEGEPIEAQAVNLSAGGVYLVSPRYFSPLSKIEITLVLPGAGGDTGGEEAGGGEPLRIDGLVVRCAPEHAVGDGRPERFAVGIAFLHLASPERQRIESYVNWRFERSLLESAGA